MKFCFLLALSLGTALPVLAQPAPGVTVPAEFQTDAKSVLSPDFVRDADFIAVAHLSRDENDPTIARVSVREMEDVRGWRFMAGRGLVLPTSLQNTASLSRDLTIVIGRFDPIREQVVLLARLDATPENVAQIKALEAANRRLKLSFSSDKSEYDLNEPIVLKWEVRNVSSVPQKIYTGPFARQWSLSYDNTSHSTSTGGTHTRKAEDYVEIQPGEVWSQTQSTKGPFPQGQVEIKMTLDSTDTFLGSDLSGAKREERLARPRIEGVVMVRETQEFLVRVKAPDANAQAALFTQLSSANWNEAFVAASTLAQVDGLGARPEIKRLSRHSWPPMRILAAQALSRNATTLSPELRALLFDVDPQVRRETTDWIRRQRVGEAGLSLLAMAAVRSEAVQKGVLPEKSPRPDLEVLLAQTRESNKDLGDLLAARIEAGKANADGINAPYILNFLADNFQTTRLRTDQPATPEQRAAILTAWKTASPDVKPAGLKMHSSDDLDAEIKAARTSMFDDFSVSPRFGEVVTHLQNLYGKFFPRPDNPDRLWFESLDNTTRLDALHALEWGSGRTLDALDNAPAWRAISQIEGPGKNEAFRVLLGKIYNAQNGIYQSENLSYFAPIALAKLDFARAQPHLDIMLGAKAPAQQLGAAVGLLVGGQKRAVPLVFEPARWERLSGLDSEELETALAQVTGQKFPNRFEWQKWWRDTGSKQEWK